LNIDVCYVFISPANSEEWGDDWLGVDEIIPPGDSRTFTMPAGLYDLMALDCEDNLLAEEYDASLSGTMDWMIEK